MEVVLSKTLSGLLPTDPDSQKWYNKIKFGNHVHADFKEYRNPAFHRKYFALLNIGFDNWEPGEINSKYGTPEKNFERFRKDIAILAGYFDLVIRLDKTSRIEARSISFAKMQQGEFEDLYSKTIDILIKNVYKNTLEPKRPNDISKDQWDNMTEEKQSGIMLNEIVNQYLQFA